MKKHLFLLMGLLALFTSNAFSYIIIIQGGTKDHKYYYIYSDDKKTVCKGRGNNSCAILTSSGAGAEKIMHQDVLNEILKRFEQGETSGSIKYNDVLPVTWSENEAKELEINIQDEKSDPGK